MLPRCLHFLLYLFLYVKYHSSAAFRELNQRWTILTNTSRSLLSNGRHKWLSSNFQKFKVVIKYSFTLQRAQTWQDSQCFTTSQFNASSHRVHVVRNNSAAALYRFCKVSSGKWSCSDEWRMPSFVFHIHHSSFCLKHM